MPRRFAALTNLTTIIHLKVCLILVYELAFLVSVWLAGRLTVTNFYSNKWPILQGPGDLDSGNPSSLEIARFYQPGVKIFRFL